LIVGESADLPREFLEKNRIIEVPFSVRFPDGEILKKENIFPKLKEAAMAGRPLPFTAAPSFKQFLSKYQQQLEQFEQILVITLSSKLSGAYSSARIARSMVREKQRVRVFDCFTAEVGEGLVAFKIQELISQGKSREEILEILKNFCPQVRLLGGLKDFKYLARSGRLHLPKTAARIISLLSKIGLCFLFEVKEGKIKFLGLRFGQDLARILYQEIEKELKGKERRVAIAFGGNLKDALKLKNELEKKKGIKILFLSQVSAVVGVYTGPEVLIAGLSPL
jgi:DegV family protein with EDD domain